MWPGEPLELPGRWEELHTLASEPWEQHVLLAEQADDATNGLLSTLAHSALCTIHAPGKALQPRRLTRNKVGSGVGKGMLGSDNLCPGLCSVSQHPTPGFPARHSELGSVEGSGAGKRTYSLRPTFVGSSSSPSLNPLLLP